MSNPHNVLLDTSAIIDLERLDEQRIADSLPLVTRNPDDFAGLESQIQVIVA